MKLKEFFKTKNWRWYNKLDTKLSEKGGKFMKRKVYDRQFKIAAVKVALEDEVTVSQVANELGINGNVLRRWISEYEKNGESAFPGYGNALLNATYEIKKLQKKNDDLKMENEILKKFQAFLKQKNM